MKAFVAGATGETGRRIVQELVQRGIPTRALVRDIAKAQQVLPPGVEVVVGDVSDPQGLVEAIADSTVMLIATGATPSFDITGPYQVDYQGTLHLVDAARSAGMEHVVLVSSLCVSQLFHPLNLFWLILYWKKQAETYLQQSELPYTIVRPGGLRNDEDNTHAIVMAGADTLFEGSIPRTAVARVCVEALTALDAKNKIVEIVASAEAAPRSLVDLFGSVA